MYCVKPHLIAFLCHYSLQSGPRYLCRLDATPMLNVGSVTSCIL